MKKETVDLGVSQGIGIPLGQIVVWILEAFLLADPIPSEIAIAIGSVIGGAIYFLKARFYDEKSSDVSSGGTD